MSVLVVDSSEETREVLRSALEVRGVRTVVARGGREAVAMVRNQRPTCIVIDVETTSLPDEWAGDDTPMVMIGMVERPQVADRREFVSKPYHYGPLIRRIEALLSQVRSPAAES